MEHEQGVVDAILEEHIAVASSTRARQRLVIAQLRAWSLADLVTAGSTLSANVLAARQNAGLAGAIASRCLLSLARKGLSLRLDR